MKILFKYISVNFLKLFFICLASFLFIYLTVDFMVWGVKLIGKGVPALLVVQLFLFKIPQVMNQATPMATLLATLLTLGMLSRNSEITVMKSCGISIFQISIPVLFLSLLISIFSIAVNEYISPYTTKRVKEIEDYRPGIEVDRKLYKKNNIWYFGKDNIVKIDLLDNQNRALRGVTILNVDADYRVKSRVDAKRADWEGNKWIFRDGVIRHFNDGLKLERFSEKEIALEEKFSDFTVISRTADEMNLKEIKKHINKMERMGLDAKKYVVDLFAKIAFPMASLILSLIGIPYSLKTGRSSGIAAGVGLSIIIGFTYWIAMAFNVSLGHVGVLPPLLAAFGANIIFALVGIISIMNVKS